MPHTSFLSAAELTEFFEVVEERYKRLLELDPSLNYLGRRPEKLFWRVPLPASVNATFFSAMLQTEEFAIFPLKFAELVRAALLRRNVRTILNAKVLRVGDADVGAVARLRVVSTHGEHDADVVVNCLWEGRAEIDRSADVPQWSGLNMRFKFGLRLPFETTLADVPSVTIVNGPFGDFVQYPGHDSMYFSWYPVSARGPVVGHRVPADWDRFARGDIPPEMANRLWASHKAQMQLLFPNARPTRAELIGGFILGNGQTDIVDPESELHGRSDTSIKQRGCFFSLSTQKFTNAPHVARQLVDMLDASAECNRADD